VPNRFALERLLLQILSKKCFQLVKRNQIRLVLQINVSCVWNDVQTCTIDGCAEIFCEEIRRRKMPRFTAAVSVVRRVKCKSHKTTFCHVLSINTGTLFFNAAIGRTLDDCRRDEKVTTLLGRRRSVQGVRPVPEG
jgi:hypothetical protein